MRKGIYVIATVAVIGLCACSSVKDNANPNNQEVATLETTVAGNEEINTVNGETTEVKNDNNQEAALDGEKDIYLTKVVSEDPENLVVSVQLSSPNVEQAVVDELVSKGSYTREFYGDTITYISTDETGRITAKYDEWDNVIFVPQEDGKSYWTTWGGGSPFYTDTQEVEIAVAKDAVVKLLKFSEEGQGYLEVPMVDYLLLKCSDAELEGLYVDSWAHPFEEPYLWAGVEIKDGVIVSATQYYEP